MSIVIDRQVVDSVVINALVGFGLNRSDVTADAVFDDLDLDSLDVVELRQVVKKSLAVDLRLADFDRVETLGDLLGLIYRQAGV